MDKNLKSLFTHMTTSYANLLEKKKIFTWGKGWNLTALVWDTNTMDAASNSQPVNQMNISWHEISLFVSERVSSFDILREY